MLQQQAEPSAALPEASMALRLWTEYWQKYGRQLEVLLVSQQVPNLGSVLQNSTNGNGRTERGLLFRMNFNLLEYDFVSML
jgi:hypothetical protein